MPRQPLVLLLAATLSLSLLGAAPGPGAADEEGAGDTASTDGAIRPAAPPVDGLVRGVVRTAVDRASGVARTVGCAGPFELVEGVGCARRTGDGMLEHVAPDGQISTTHGHDAASVGDDDGHDHDHAELASTSSSALPSARRPLLCTPKRGYRTVVLYAYVSGSADRRSSHLSTIRRTLERSNQAVAESARRSGGPAADLRVRCTSSGIIGVTSLRVPSRNFADVKAAAAAAGFNAPNEKYLIFGDFESTSSNVGGIADMFLDDRRSTANRNNGSRAMYGLIFGPRNFGGTVPLHELAHTMGAVQPKAPHADGHGHCGDNADILCYPSSRTPCSTRVFDCGNDTYFSTATRKGDWLHANWNLGWSGNRFIQVASSEPKTASTPPIPSGAVPVPGDWDGDGRSQAGWFHRGTFYLVRGSGAVTTFRYGRAGDQPVSGDWNGSGRDGIGVFRDGNWYLRNSLSSGASWRHFRYGRAGDQPVAGDWNRTGRDGIGVFRRGTWYVRNPLSSGPSWRNFRYGRTGDTAITGDWEGLGRDGVGVVRRGYWYVRSHLKAGPSRFHYPYGRSTDVAVAGDWNGNGRTTSGIVRNQQWRLTNFMTARSPDVTWK